MRLFLENKKGDIVCFDHVWSISSLDAMYTRIRTYNVEMEKMGEEFRPVSKFKDDYLQWVFSHATSCVYGRFINHIGVSRKSRSVESKRADENLCFKLLCVEEMSEIEKGGMNSPTWAALKDSYDERDLPF